MLLRQAKATSIRNKSNFNSSLITMSNYVKYLDIVIDKKLNFGKHISMLQAKLSKSIGVLNKLKHTLPKHALLTLYI